MITVTISETNGHRTWSHRARTKDALTAIIRAMNAHFPPSYHFIPDDTDNPSVLFAVTASIPEVNVIGHIWKPMWHRGIRWNVRGTPVTISLHHSSL
ncbi:hypothetical protein D6445_11855 [Salmonella enterica subsp. enterica serovar Infantis]|nr:hypothetical protein [Salmonella enterica subsp. enterica serovar Infantis]EGI5923279.1 hypothetical protein [Salmonella enterica subsp. enterica serovar Colindale]